MPAILRAAVPVFLALICAEYARLRALEGRGPLGFAGYEARDTAASLAMGAGNLAVAAGAGLFLAPLYWLAWEHRLLDPGTGAAVFVALFFVEDFVYYWYHRLSHEVRFLWAAHENHHSSRRYNLSTALRQSWTMPFTAPLFYLWLPLLGFHPAMIATQVAVSLLYQFWLHTELVGRLGPLEWILNTPSHHRVHHGSNVEYLDRNHGGILIVWDRLFGTFEPERAPVVYGLTKNIDTFSPLRIAFHEWARMLREVARAASAREALGRVLAPPGWSPDGATQTAAQMRAALRASQGAPPSADPAPRKAALRQR
jgi:sterol desaturase/sphingolipid hydroxylase (fatty acid hydroxylase superfamily)